MLYGGYSLTKISQYDDLEFSMMRFSSDSKALVILSGSTFASRYTVLVIRLEDGDKAFGEATFVVSETTGDTAVHEAK